MKKLRVRAGMFATILSFLSLVFCAPPDRPYDTKYSKSPLAEPINTRAGYSYYLIGRLMQARYIVETAYGKGEPKFVQAKDQATNQKKELTAGENKVSHSCQQERILESRREGRENYSFKF
ncbi:MAG: hypothetical protein KDD35_01015, partial [Bdellovibrionales bacterium]|nr:hypothetical protein [Bdellovibrionales bacterium]